MYISENEKGFPRLEIIDGGNATGIIDAGTGLLKEGYAVLERDDSDNPITEAYFTVGNIRVFQGGKFRDIPNNAPYPLLVPIIFRPDAVRPFGQDKQNMH